MLGAHRKKAGLFPGLFLTIAAASFGFFQCLRSFFQPGFLLLYSLLTLLDLFLQIFDFISHYRGLL
jgi:hypothetical protein